MSNVSTAHTIELFDAKKSKSLSGQRLAKIGYKQTAKMTELGQIAPASICVSVPCITAEEISAELPKILGLVRNTLEGKQDEMIRALYESRGSKIESFSAVLDSEISIAAIAAFHESESSGGRLTKEYLESWFNKNVADNLFVTIAEKLGFSDITEENSAVIDQKVAGFRGVIASLSGGRTVLSSNIRVQARKAIELMDESAEDETAQKLLMILDRMEKAELDLLMAL
jgi:hypothetical protein